MSKKTIARIEQLTSDRKFGIQFSKQAEKFFAKQHIFTEDAAVKLLAQALRYLLKIERTNLDLKPLQGEFAGLYRLRKGNIRMIFSYENGEVVIAEIAIIDFRGNVY